MEEKENIYFAKKEKKNGEGKARKSTERDYVTIGRHKDTQPNKDEEEGYNFGLRIHIWRRIIFCQWRRRKGKKSLEENVTMAHRQRDRHCGDSARILDPEFAI